MATEYNGLHRTAEVLVEDMKIDAYGFGAIHNWRNLQQLLASASKRTCRVLLLDFPFIVQLTVDSVSLERFTCNPDIWLLSTRILIRIVDAEWIDPLLQFCGKRQLSAQLLELSMFLQQRIDNFENAQCVKMFELSESLLLCLLCAMKLVITDSEMQSYSSTYAHVRTVVLQYCASVYSLHRQLLLKLLCTFCSVSMSAESPMEATLLIPQASGHVHINEPYSVCTLPTTGRGKVLYLLYLHSTLHSWLAQTLCIEVRLTHEPPVATVIQLYSALYYLNDCIFTLHAYQHDASILAVAVDNTDHEAVHALLTAYPLLIHHLNDEGHSWLHKCCMQDYSYYLECNKHLHHVRSRSSCSSIDTTNTSPSPIRTAHTPNSPTLPPTPPSTLSMPLLSPEEYVERSERVLEVLLNFNIDVNAPDCTGRTALHCCNSSRAVTLLCNSGADPNVSDSTGITPLHQYVLSNRIECIRVLLRYGADPSICESMKKRSSVHYAAMLGMYDVLYTLLRYSTHMIDLEARDSSGNTALHLCAACQSTDPSKCVLLLLNQGAAVKAVTYAGITALHLLCCNALFCTPHNTTSEPLIEVLLQRGANPNAQDKDGCTPLIVACAYREFALCKLLLHYGGDLNIPCSMHSTFLSVGFVDHCVDIHSECSEKNDSDKSKDTRNYVNNTSSHTDYEDIDSMKSDSTNLHSPNNHANTLNSNYMFDYSYYTNTSNTAALDTITATDLLPKKPRYAVFSSINSLQSRIPCANRDRCMNCGDYFNSSDSTVYNNNAMNSVFGSVYPGNSSNSATNNNSAGTGIGSVYASISSMVQVKFRSGRHHCRLCRRVVCIQCSSRMLSGTVVPLFVREQYTHEKEYRMCDICYDVLCDRDLEREDGTCSGNGATNTDASGATESKPSKGSTSPFGGFGFMGFYK